MQTLRADPLVGDLARRVLALGRSGLGMDSGARRGTEARLAYNPRRMRTLEKHVTLLLATDLWIG